MALGKGKGVKKNSSQRVEGRRVREEKRRWPTSTSCHQGQQGPGFLQTPDIWFQTSHGQRRSMWTKCCAVVNVEQPAVNMGLVSESRTAKAVAHWGSPAHLITWRHSEGDATLHCTSRVAGTARLLTVLLKHVPCPRLGPIPTCFLCQAALSIMGSS